MNHPSTSNRINNNNINTGYKDGEVTVNETSPAYSTCHFGCCTIPQLGGFLFQKGFIEGDCSDVSIKAFGKTYNLHRIILSRSGYFSSLFNGPWSDPSFTEHELNFDDEYITKEAFEIAIANLYGCNNYNPTSGSVFGYNMIAVGQYLSIPYLVCEATDSIIQNLNMNNLTDYLPFATSNNYGSASERIIDSARGVLSSYGWESGVEKWDGIPEEIIAEVVVADCFFVLTEWDRCLFIIKLIERRALMFANEKSDKEFYNGRIKILKDALDNGIHFCHLTAEQLYFLETSSDPRGLPYVNPGKLKDALWEQISLQKKIVTSSGSPVLGLASNYLEKPDDGSRWFRIPIKDETICATPMGLEQIMDEHQRTPLYKSDSVEGKSAENDTEATGGVCATYTKTPPFRFSIAFANVSKLNSGKRVYAKTLWYSGSYWNLYLQKVKNNKRKGYQVGVYLHRASSPFSSRHGLINPDVFANGPNYSPVGTANETFEEYTNADTEFINNGEIEPGIDYFETLTVNDEEDPDSSFNIRDRREDDTSFRPDSSTKTGTATTTTSNISPNISDRSFLAYDDPRSKISVYFVIYTPSRRVKSAITSFTSAPDSFNRSQSWGWKSNSMCVFDENGNFPPDHEPHLKFMVILGII